MHTQTFGQTLVLQVNADLRNKNSFDISVTNLETLITNFMISVPLTNSDRKIRHVRLVNVVMHFPQKAFQQ